MSNPLIAEIVKLVISGLFGLLAAVVPIYIQKRRPKDKVVRSYAEGLTGVKPLYIALVSLVYFLFWDALLSIFVGVNAGLGIIMGPSAENQVVAVFRDGALQKVSWDEYWQLATTKSYFYETVSFIVDSLMIGPALLVGSYAGRRADRMGIATLLTGVVLAMAIIKVSNEMRATDDFQYSYEFLFMAFHLAAALAGYYWGRRSKGAYLMARIYKRMDAEDRNCLFDLAREVTEDQGGRRTPGDRT